jgi:hypothetical protein
LLPVEYFHVVFTLPAELRHIVRSNQRVLLRVLLAAAFASLAASCADPRWLGGRIGALASTGSCSPSPPSKVHNAS